MRKKISFIKYFYIIAYKGRNATSRGGNIFASCYDNAMKDLEKGLKDDEYVHSLYIAR